MSVFKHVVLLTTRSLLGKSVAHFRELDRLQWAGKEALESVTRQRLERLLRHASRRSPFYREALDRAGVVRGDEIDLRNFSRIPLLDKTMLRARLPDIASDDLTGRKWFYNTTGGSTGEPARFIQDAEYSDWTRSIKMLFDDWSGYRIGQRKIGLWVAGRDLHGGGATPRKRFGRWLRNERWLSAVHLSDEQMREYIRAINRSKPVQILAYAHSLFELARFIEKEGLAVHSPRSIMTSAGTLYPFMRESIQRAFRAPVFNRYGSREIGDVACECAAHSGLHVCPGTHLVEVLREDGSPAAAGETGEIVVTVFFNLAMPLIRYRTGDLGSWAEGPCSCGRALPVLKEITGRTIGILRTAAGVLDGAALISLLVYKDAERKVPFSSFSKYQIRQESADRIELRVVLDDAGAWEEEKQIIRPAFEAVLGAGVEVSIREVDEIAPAPSGKHFYVIGRADER